MSEIVEEPQMEIAEEDYVYVAVGRGRTSSDALTWTLDNMVPPGSRTTIFLVHIYPEVRSIPTPLGPMHKSQVNPSQIENYMLQVRENTREFLLPFINMCHRRQVNVETILIESDNVVTAITELIPVLQIRKLVMGSTRHGSRRPRLGAAGKAVQIRDGAAGSCEVKIICEGREVSPADRTPPSPRTDPRSCTSSPTADGVSSSPPAPSSASLTSPRRSLAESQQHPAAGENEQRYCTTCICFR